MNKKKLTILISIIICLAALFCVGLFAVSKSRSAEIEDKLDLGEKYLGELKYEKALAAYKEVLKIDPKSVDAYLGMAEVYVAMGEYEEAMKILEEGYEETGDQSLNKEKKKVEELLGGVEYQDSEEVQVEVSVEYAYRYPDVDATGGYETAVLIGCRTDGKEVWRYQTEEVYAGDMGPIFLEIGLYNDMYYFCENGSLVVFEPETGNVLWRNEDAGYIQYYVFDEAGNIYCTSSWGPDLLILDREGNILQKVDKLDIEYDEPGRIEVVENYVFITYNLFKPYHEYNPLGFVLYYCLHDGSTGRGYSVLEQEPKFQGVYYGSSYRDELYIEYQLNGTYLVSLYTWDGEWFTEVEGHFRDNGLYLLRHNADSEEDYFGRIEKLDDNRVQVSMKDDSSGEYIAVLTDYVYYFQYRP